MSIFAKFIILLFGNNQKKENNDNQSVSPNPKKWTEEQWRAKLTPNQYYILREKGTELPFSGKLLYHKAKGTYHCAGCGELLFNDEMKFDSGSGWPSFDDEVGEGKIDKLADFSGNRERTEIICANCGGHLGHIFADGPTATGKRYCVDSDALLFNPAPDTDSITLAAGCFWCVEAIFKQINGVLSVMSGYSGGKVENPTYEEVCTGETGHAEVVQINFNTKILTLEKLLEVFFSVHDPTTLNSQGVDVGTQYRSAIFYHNEKQKEIATAIISKLNQNQVFPQPIVTEITPFDRFYLAEKYHHDYFKLHAMEPYCQRIIRPKLDKFEKIYSDILRGK